jgi:hypothetical protein
MFKRTQERAIPPGEIDRSVPKGANDIVNKCLETDREKRYQTVTGLLEDLDNFDPAKKIGAATRAKVQLRKASRLPQLGDRRSARRSGSAGSSQFSKSIRTGSCCSSCSCNGARRRFQQSHG